MKKNGIFLWIVVLLVALLSQQTFAQKTKSSRKFQFYGGIGFWLSNDGYQISLQPGVIYNLSKKYKIGGGLHYEYLKDRNVLGASRSVKMFGANIINLFYPIENLELSADYEQLYVIQNYSSNSRKYRIPALYVGVGYRSGNFAAGLKYDFLHEDGKSVYENALIPYIRFYF